MFHTPPITSAQLRNDNISNTVQYRNATTNMGFHNTRHISSSSEDLITLENNVEVHRPTTKPIPHSSTFVNNERINSHQHFQTRSYVDDFSNFSNQAPCYVTSHEAQLSKELELCKMKIQELTLQVESQKRQPPSSIHYTQDNRRHVPSTQNPSNQRELENRFHGKMKSQNIRDNFEKSLKYSDTEVSSSDNDFRKHSRQRKHYVKCEMQSWPIRFSKGNGIKFWKRIEKLQRSYEYDDEMIFKYFHLLLQGHALEWYWQFCDEYENSNLKHLKTEFCRVFTTIESDMTLVSSMYSQRQGRDTFEKFYNDIIDKNFNLKDPLSDEQIIEILKTNMDDEVRQRIFTFETTDRIKFFHKANKAYLDVCQMREKKKSFYDNKFGRKIHELDFDEFSSHEIEEISAKINNWKFKKSNLKCFNCQSDKHLLAKCPEDITRFFCFKCGLDGYATPKCPSCNLNQHRSAE